MTTIGEQLKQARLGRKLTIKQAVQATRVRSYYLEAMEADDFSAIPSAAQARGFLRLYAEYLGLNPDDLNASQRGELTSVAASTTDAPQTLAATPPAKSPAKPLPAAEPVKPNRLEAPAKPAEPLPAPEPEPDPGPATPSQNILNEIGAALRERRELLSLTLDEIERHTHVRKHYLEKIETGSIANLPSPVQARGMLNAYASFLDMDSDAILLRFADALQARRIERQGAQPSSQVRKPMRLPAWLKWFVSPDLIFGGGMVLLLLGLSIWGAARLLSSGNAPAAATATEGPSISEVLLASPVGGETPTEEILPTSVPELATAVPTVDEASIIPTETSTLALEFVPASAVNLTVIILERTFLRVIVDGETKQDGRVAPGAALTFDGSQRIELLTGSGAAIQVIYNQQDQGVLGNFGEVVNRIYTIQGVETPTSTATLTPSVTPRRPPSATPTITPRATSTPIP